MLVWLSGWTSSDTHPMRLTLNLRTYHPNEKPHTSSARGKGIQECLELAPDSPLHSSPQPSQVCLLQKKRDHLKEKKKRLMLSQATPCNLTITTGRILVKRDIRHSMCCPRSHPESPRISPSHCWGHWSKQISTSSPWSRIKGRERRREWRRLSKGQNLPPTAFTH